MQIFRQIGALSLLTLLFVKAMVAPAIFFNYELRKDFIIQNFCENKDRPELECDGQCYLAKQLKAAQQEDENEATATFVDKLLVLECLSEDTDWLLKKTNFSNLEKTVIHRNQNLNGKKFLQAIFHPPQLFS